MSLQRHLQPFKYQVSRSALAVALAGFSLLTACAGTTGASSDMTVAVPDRPPAVSMQTELDQDPIDRSATKDNIARLPLEQAPALEESEMTVLVLEDSQLLALASRMNNPAPSITPPPVRPEVERFQFAFDAHRLDPQAEQILRRHGQYLEAHPEQKVQIDAHTDTQGAESYNRFLSRLRASAAARILKEEGAREEQIEVQAFAGDRPLSPGAHAANRRLELSYTESRLASVQNPDQPGLAQSQSQPQPQHQEQAQAQELQQ